MKKKHIVASALSLGLLGGVIAIPSAIFADSDAVTDSANTSTTATQDAGTTFSGRVQGGAIAQSSFVVSKGDMGMLNLI